MERKKIGILGGTLDPVHLGHLALLRMAREQLKLDEVVLLPSGDPPHKQCHVLKEDRLAMARLAAGAEFSVSDAEIVRPGHTYTVDTLRAVRLQRPDWDIVYIIGADTMPNLVTWREYPEVFRLTAFAAAERPGYREIPPEGARVLWLTGSPPDLSSTAIRARAAERKPLRGMVPERVEEYIRQNGLYLMSIPEDEAVSKLSEMLPPGRFRHALGVRDTAGRLAEIHGLDAAAARVAGLLHDAAKGLSLEKMLQLAGGDADDGERTDAQLMHAPAGAALARDAFGVRDAEILSAIRNHTLGKPSMTGLELSVFVADFIEPNRRNFPGLSEVRALAEKDLAAAARRATELTYADLQRRGKAPHARTSDRITQYGR